MNDVSREEANLEQQIVLFVKLNRTLTSEVPNVVDI